MTDALSAMPSNLVAGDNLSLCLTGLASTHPSSSGWSVSLVLVPLAGGTPVSTDATGGATSWDVVVASAATNDFTPGCFRWAITASKSGERTTVSRGQLNVLADPSDASVDARSHARKVLDALNATLENRATKTQLEFEYEDGRRIKHMDHEQLLVLRKEYARKVAAEEQGGSGPKKVLMRL